MCVSASGRVRERALPWVFLYREDTFAAEKDSLGPFIDSPSLVAVALTLWLAVALVLLTVTAARFKRARLIVG